RTFFTLCAQAGLAATVLPETLWSMAEQKTAITREMLDEAALVADVPIADEYKDMMLESLNDFSKGYDAIHELHIQNPVAPAVLFDPVPPGMKLETDHRPMKISAAPAVAGRAPGNLEDVAFASVRELAELMRTKRVSSTALTGMYLERLKRY